MVCAEGAEGLPHFYAPQQEVLRRDVNVLPDVCGHVHAVPEPQDYLVHGLRVLRLTGIGEQPVANVLQHLNVPVTGEGASVCHGLVKVDVVAEEAYQTLSQVRDVQEDLRGQKGEDQRSPVRAVVRMGRGEAKCCHGVHTNVSPAPEHQNLKRKV